METLQPLVLLQKLQIYHILRSFWEKKAHILNKIGEQNQRSAIPNIRGIAYLLIVLSHLVKGSCGTAEEKQDSLNHSKERYVPLSLERWSVREFPCSLFFSQAHCALVSLRIQKIQLLNKDHLEDGI